MSTVYFLGAGASAADDLPLTNELNLAIAAHLRRLDNAHGPLASYYKQLYGIDGRQLRAATVAWNRFLRLRGRETEAARLLPNVVETLSLIDQSIADGVGFGAQTRRWRREVLFGPTMLAVRQQMTEAIALGVKEAAHYKRAPWTKLLASKLRPGDSIVTTNWDILIDRALTDRHRQESGRRKRRLYSTNIDYCGVEARPVDWLGEDLPPAPQRFKLLKLHGSLNWFYCSRCNDLYSNVSLSWYVDEDDPRPGADYCHCGMPLRTIIIAPSYVKDYRNVHLQSVWRHAHTALRLANRWLFVGYSLPADDYHIRGLLLRALRARLDEGDEHGLPDLEIRVVYQGRDDQREDDLERRYSELLRLCRPRFFSRGMRAFLGNSRVHWQ
jgi:hypothetical protein